MRFKFIVISACEKRKQKLVDMFKELNIPNDLIYYLDASVPENSQDYLADCKHTSRTVIRELCCAKSHLRAIEHATRDESPDYSIIVEDDVAFHKTDFLSVVDNIIDNWEIKFQNIYYVSLGWIPCNNYSIYEKYDSSITIPNLSEYKFFKFFYNVGLQAYIVKKDKMKHIIPIINQPTYNNLEYKLKETFSKMYENPSKIDTIAIDQYLNRLVSFTVIFPHLAIEQNTHESLLGHKNFETYWMKFFENYEDNIKKYMTY